jgi:acyl-CoA synthetase (AMP-forming)/AMP-acid ligase II
VGPERVGRGPPVLVRGRHGYDVAVSGPVVSMRAFASLRTIGSSLPALGKSGLLGPYTPGQAVRAVRAVARTGINLGAVYPLAAALHPGGTAAVDDAGRATFAEMDRRSAAVAAGLAERGIDASSRVAVLCRNHRGFLLAVAALGRLGADTVYLNTGFSGPQLTAVTVAEGVGALIVDEEFLGVAADVDPSIPVIVAWFAREATARRHPTLQAMLADDRPPGPAPRPGRAGRQVLLTSGTTGTPKGADRGPPNDPGPVLGLLARIPYRRSDTTVMAAPMFHAWGLANTALALAFGATIVTARHFDPEDTLRLVAETRADVLVAVPVMLQRILELPDDVTGRYDVSSLRAVALSGSALPGGLALRWMDAFGDNLYNLYGSTEIGWVSVAGPADLRAAPGTAGRILPGVDVRFVDATGGAVAAGTPGRILVASALTFDGYTGGGGKEVLDGAMASGDVGHLEGGLLFVDGRDDDMIVSGGENVFPREVEDLIADHPDVVEVSVAGVPDDEFGQRLEAWVVRRPGSTLDADAVRSLVRSRLARYKVPRAVHFVDRLPRTTTGKVLRRALTR